MYPTAVRTLIDAAIRRLLDDLGRGEGYAALQAEQWIHSLAGTDHPADYFTHPLAFPMLLLPWWLEQTLRTEPDAEFQADLIFSSIAGYYFIRLIDNVMDGHGTQDQKLLPLLGLFHLHFQRTYYVYFPNGHPFWQTFAAISRQSAESALRDGALNSIDLEQFIAVAGKKVAGGKIPLAAVSYRYNLPSLYERWQVFYDKLGCWHQMYNDLFGWTKDLRHRTSSYFLSEARRRTHSGQSLAAWVADEGFAWGVATLEAWLDELYTLAEGLESRELSAYLHHRQRILQEQSASVERALSGLARLLNLPAK